MPVLETKISIPSPRRDILNREDLFKTLDSGLSRRLVLVIAPAGFGKSILVSSWLKSRSKACAWVSLDERDDDPIRFWTYLTVALRRLDEDIGSDALAGLETEQSDSIDDIVISLINDIDACSHPLYLVLDDFHFIAAQKIMDTLAFFIRHQPANLHLIVCTRQDPNLPLSYLRVGGDLLELKAKDLRFSEQEIVTLLNDMHKLALDSKDIQALTRLTEGWAAGLQLALISLKEETDCSGFIHKLSGTQRHIMEYLVEEVLNHLPEYVQTFLIRTSILERISEDLCNALYTDPVSGTKELNIPNSGEIIKYIVEHGIFLEPLDDERRWHRYHQLFADMLRFRQRKNDPDSIPELHKRASVWLADKGLLLEALDHAKKSQDNDLMVTLLERHAFTLLCQSETRTVLNYIDHLSGDILHSNPSLMVFLCWALVLVDQIGSVGRVEELLETAEKRAGALAFEERNWIRGQIISIKAFVLQSPLRPNHSAGRLIEYSQEANKLLPAGQEAILAVNELNQGYAALELGRMDGAYKHFKSSYQLGMRGGNLYAAVYAAQNLAQLHLVENNLEAARSLCNNEITLFEDRAKANGISIPAVGSLYILLGRIALERFDLDSSEELLWQGIKQIKWTGEHEILLLAYTSLITIYSIKGDFSETSRLIHQFSKLGSGIIGLETGLQAEIDSWCKLLNPGPPGRKINSASALDPSTEYYSQLQLHPLGEFAFSTLCARLRMAILDSRLPSTKAKQTRIKYKRVIETLEKNYREARRIGAVHRLIRCALYLAAALSSAAPAASTSARSSIRQEASDSEGAGAAAYFKEALLHGEQGGYLLPFVELGSSILPLVKGCSMESSYLELVKKTLEQGSAATAKQPPYVSKYAHRGTGNLKEPLTKRELEILGQLAKGMSNKQIGEVLFISPYTVRAHTYNIYSKLRVHNRTEAVTKARKLALLRDSAVKP